MYDELSLELAITTKDGLCYDSGITTDVITNITPERITEIMIKIQKLPTRKELWVF